jgi:hypothetical protein
VWSNGKHPDRFEANPAGFAVLDSVAYGCSPSLDEIARIKEKLCRTSKNLCESAVWTEVRATPAGAIHPAGAPTGRDFGAIRLWGATDLVYNREGVPVVVDWKSGTVRVDDARAQLAIYSAILPGHWPPQIVEGWFVDLGSATDLHLTVTPEEAVSAVRHAEAKAADVRRRTDELSRGRLSLDEAFPQTSARVACPRCNYRSLCNSPDLGKLAPEGT